MSKKFYTYLKNGVEVPSGTVGAVRVSTRQVGPEEGLYQGGMTKGTCDYRTALFVDNGAVDPSCSVVGALQGGTYGDAAAENITIHSENKHFNGIMVNNSDYKVNNVTFIGNGSGGNDFKGFGAGIAVYGASKLEADGYVFTGAGQVRHGVFAGGTTPRQNLAVNVKNSYIKADGSKYESAAEGMSSCPWMLGISPDGHARATMCDGYSNVTYENDILLSDGWGVLSVDDTGDTVLFGDYSIELQVRNSVVDVTTEGTDDPSCYATYSIGGCRNSFYGCTIGNAADSEHFKALKSALPDTGIAYDYATKKYGLTYAAVVANEHASAGWYQSNVTTKFGVMYHKTNNVRYVPGAEDDSSARLRECGVTEVEYSTFNTEGAAFLIKACTPVISVVNSKFNSEKGVIAQLMTCDDPGMGTPAFSEVLDLSAPVEKDPAYNPCDYNVKNEKLFRKFDVEKMIGDPQLSFKDCNKANGTELNGDFYNSVSVATNGEGMIWWGQNMILTFDHCDLNGTCSSSSALHDRYSYYLAEADNEYGGIPVNQDGYEIAGTWAKPSFGPPMPSDEEMPEMPPMGDMPGGEMPEMPAPSYFFTPDYDADGNLIVTGSEALVKKYGCIVSKNATYLGCLSNTATPTVNNGVWVELKNGSVWNAKDTSYLTRLCVSADSKINGTVTVDGTELIPEADKVYTGVIVVTG